MVFNLIGYRFVFTYLESKATSKLDAIIDTGAIKENALFEIAVPLQMPYISDKEYEPAYGHTIINGIQYHFVKRKISGNTLFLLCIPNIEKTNLEQAKNDFANADYNKNSPSKKNHKNLNTSSTDFFENYNTFPALSIFSCKKSLYTIAPEVNLPELFFLTPEQPPENVS